MEWSPWKAICTFFAICYIIGDTLSVWLEWPTLDQPNVEGYVPNSELEHMKDKVFALVDWES